MITRQTALLFDGKKSVNLESFPEDAWTSFGNLSHEKPVDIEKLRQLRRHVGLMFRCVNIRANSLTKVPWVIRTKGDTVLWRRGEQVPDSLLWLKVLPRFLHDTEAALCLGSQAYWFKAMNRVKVTELKWLAPISVVPIWDERLGLTHFERRVGGMTVNLKPEELVYLWKRDPMHETQPDVPPAEAAMASANVIYNVDEFTAAFFSRGAIKATLLTIKGNPPPEEKKRLKAWWQRFFSGVRNAWGAEIINADAIVPVIVGEGIQELSNTDLMEEKRNDVATTMGVPHSLLFSDAANHATAKQDEQNFYNQTIVPDCDLIAELVNDQLLNPLGLHLEWHPNEMDVFQADETERSQSFAHYVGAGMKASIAAQILGIDLPDGIEYEMLDVAIVEAAEGEEAVSETKDILGYHIEQGIATRNEARADVGLPPVVDDMGEVLRDLRAKLELLTIAKNAGVSVEGIAQQIGLKVEVPEPVAPQPTNGAAQNEERQAESKRFRAWAKKRLGKVTFDPTQFESDLLTPADKAAIVAEMSVEALPEPRRVTLAEALLNFDRGSDLDEIDAEIEAMH